MIIPQANIERAIAERSLSQFIKRGWGAIDPADYMTNWHIDSICEHLEMVSRGDIRRLIINVPPRHMKSISVSVAWPAWTWAQRKTSPLTGPDVGFLGTSYAHSLSMRDNVKCRRLIASNWYQSQWADRFALTGDQNTKIRFENDKGGYRLASSVDGTATGEGGDIVMIDDAMSAADAQSVTKRATVAEWWDATISTRLNDPKTGAYVVIMQRLHEQDLVGHILDREKDWTVLCLPARYEANHPHVYALDPRAKDGELLWPTRMGELEVSKLETALGSYGAAGQLQQRPAPRDGGMFKRRWFEIIDAAPAGLRYCRAWDLAASAPTPGRDPDYTVGAKVGKDPKTGMFYLVDMERFREGALHVERAMLNTAKADGTSCEISLPEDPGQAGKAQAAALVRMLAGHKVKATRPTGAKDVRATPFAAQCEAGNVKIVAGPWVADFLNEIDVFPFGKHDDTIDAFADGFNTLANQSKAAQWLAALETHQSNKELLNG
jgi:predicted phage terminase large subunit-like protein